MKPLICITLLVLSALAEEDKTNSKTTITKRGFIGGQVDASAVDLSTLEHAGGVTSGGIIAGSTIYDHHSPWEYGIQQSVIHKPVSVPFPHPVPVKIDRPVPVPVPVSQPYPVPVDKHYPVPVIKEVPYPVIKEVPYPVVKPVPYPVEKPVPYPVVRKVPYPVHIRVDRPYPVPVPKPYPVPIVKRVLYPVEKTVHYPVHIPIKVPVPHPVPVPVPRPYPVAVPQPVPVPYDRPYPVKVIKPVPVPYERKIHVPVPHPVPHPVPVPVPKPYPVPIYSPSWIGSGATGIGHGTSSFQDFSTLFAAGHGSFGHGSFGHGGVQCSNHGGIPTGSLISNGGAIIGPTSWSPSTEHSVPPAAGPRFDSHRFDFIGSTAVSPLSESVDSAIADSSSIVEIKKSIEKPMIFKPKIADENSDAAAGTKDGKV